MPSFDEDYIPLALIALFAIVWGSSLWHGGEVTQLAGDILKVGIGAIAGYMTRDRQV